MKKIVIVCSVLLAAVAVSAAPVVKVEKAGAEKVTVTLNVGGSAA